MDLEQLKESWERLDPGGKQDIQKVLQTAMASSGRSIRRMKRNILLQAATMLVAFGLAYTQMYGRFRLPVGILYGVTTGIFCVYYYKKYRLLQSIGNQDMRTALRGKLTLLRRYLRFYATASILALPVAVAFIVLLCWYYQLPSFIAWWALGTLPLTIPCIYLSRWHIHRTYGRYIRLLEEDLKELEEKE